MTDAIGSALALVGYYSYAIYLWHPPAASGGIKLVERVFGVNLHYLVAFAIYLAASIGLGVIMTKAVELPILKLRDYLWPPRGSVRSLEAAIPQVAPAQQSDIYESTQGVP